MSARTEYAAWEGCIESQNRNLEASGHVNESSPHKGPNSTSPVPQHPSCVCENPTFKTNKQRNPKKTVQGVQIWDWLADTVNWYPVSDDFTSKWEREVIELET